MTRKAKGKTPKSPSRAPGETERPCVKTRTRRKPGLGRQCRGQVQAITVRSTGMATRPRHMMPVARNHVAQPVGRGMSRRSSEKRAAVSPQKDRTGQQRPAYPGNQTVAKGHLGHAAHERRSSCGSGSPCRPSSDPGARHGTDCSGVPRRRAGRSPLHAAAHPLSCRLETPPARSRRRPRPG